MVRQEIDKRPKLTGGQARCEVMTSSSQGDKLTGGQARCEVLYIFGNATFLTATMS